MLRAKSDLLAMQAQSVFFQERYEAAEKQLKEALKAKREAEDRLYRDNKFICEEHW